ncbi:hypothetical protein MD484_g7586, partial [Candolleomyces efflorescens]
MLASVSTPSQYGQTTTGTPTSAAGVDATDLEPSDEWKANLKKRIEGELAPMVKDAKDQLEASIRLKPEQRDRLLAEHQSTMGNIRRLAEEQFREELGRERQERRWAAGMSLENNWMESLREEQEVIYQQIKQSEKGPLPEGVADAADGGLQEQLPELRRPPQMSPEPTPAQSNAIPIPPAYEIPPLPPNMPPPPPRSSASASSSSSQRAPKPSSQRWGPESQAPGLSPSASSPRDRYDPQQESLRRKSEQQRPPLPTWASGGTAAEASSISKSPPPTRPPWMSDRPTPSPRPPPSQTPAPPSFLASSASSLPRPIDRPSTVSPLSERHTTAYSPTAEGLPSSPPPQIWKPGVPPEEQAYQQPHFNSTSTSSVNNMSSSAPNRPISSIHRRDSSASMRSIASTNSMRSITSNTSVRSSGSMRMKSVVDDPILERSDHEGDDNAHDDEGYDIDEQAHEPEHDYDDVARTIMDTQRKTMQETQRMKKLEDQWRMSDQARGGERGGGGEDDSDFASTSPSPYGTARPRHPMIPVQPIAQSSSGESKKSGKSKSGSSRVKSGSRDFDYENGYMHGGDREREGPTSKTMRAAMGGMDPSGAAGGGRPLTAQPTLLVDQLGNPYSQQMPPSSKHRPVSRKTSFIEPPDYSQPRGNPYQYDAAQGPQFLAPSTSSGRVSKRQSIEADFYTDPRRMNASVAPQTALPTPPASASGRRSSRRYGNPTVPDPSGYDEQEYYEEMHDTMDDGISGGRDADAVGPRPRSDSSEFEQHRAKRKSSAKFRKKNGPANLMLDREQFQYGPPPGANGNGLYRDSSTRQFNFSFDYKNSSVDLLKRNTGIPPYSAGSEPITVPRNTNAPGAFDTQHGWARRSVEDQSFTHVPYTADPLTLSRGYGPPPLSQQQQQQVQAPGQYGVSNFRRSQQHQMQTQYDDHDPRFTTAPPQRTPSLRSNPSLMSGAPQPPQPQRNSMQSPRGPPQWQPQPESAPGMQRSRSTRKQQQRQQQRYRRKEESSDPADSEEDSPNRYDDDGNLPDEHDAVVDMDEEQMMYGAGQQRERRYSSRRDKSLGRGKSRDGRRMERASSGPIPASNYYPPPQQQQRSHHRAPGDSDYELDDQTDEDEEGRSRYNYELQPHDDDDEEGEDEYSDDGAPHWQQPPLARARGSHSSTRTWMPPQARPPQTGPIQPPPPTSASYHQISRAPSGGGGGGAGGSRQPNWETVPPETFEQAVEKEKKKQKKRIAKEKEETERERERERELERLERDRERVRLEQDRERLDREREQLEREREEKRLALEREKEAQEREREAQERERERERERQREREREQEEERERERQERERERQRQVEKEMKERKARELEEERKNRETEKMLQDLKDAREKAEEALRLAQEAAESKQLAEEQAEDLKRRMEDADRLAREASAKHREAERQHKEALELQRRARMKEESARRKELDILRREKELAEKESQLQKLEEELKRQEEQLKYEEEMKVKKEEAERLDEELKQKMRELEDLKQKQAELKASKKEQEEELKVAKEVYAEGPELPLLDHFDQDEAPREVPIEDEWDSPKKGKGKKEKKSKGKKAKEAKEEKERREAQLEAERAEQERQSREEEERRQREEEEKRREEEEQRRREEEEKLRQEEEANARRDEEDRRRRERESLKEEKKRRKEERERKKAQQREEQERALAEQEQYAMRLQEEERLAFEAEENSKREAAERQRAGREREIEVEQMRRAREEEERFERIRKEQEEARRLDEEREKRRLYEEAQQAEFRRQEEDIKRKKAGGERKRQDSGGFDSAWTSSGSSNFPFNTGSSPSGGLPRSSPARATSTPFPTDRSGAPPAWASWGSSAGTGSAWSTGASASANPPRPATTSPNKPRAGSMGSTSFPASASGGANPPQSEAEWHQRQAEQARQQQERFRQEQELLARRQTTRSGAALTKDEMAKLHARYDQMWKDLTSKDNLRWTDFPWPVARMPSTPEDITTLAIESYLLSPLYPDNSRSERDRIKDSIKRWHPDRFETKLLLKVSEDEKEKVREGAGSVVRSLNDLLAKRNESDSLDHRGY